MKWLLFLLLLLPAIVEGQIITTVAGNGTSINSGDGGPASASAVDYPCGGVFDKFGNYYFATGDDGNSVRKISKSGTITTVAGTIGVSGYSGDGGQATNAKMSSTQAVAVDTFGNIYIVDATNNRIRKVDIATGVISTIAGNGIGGYNGDDIQATNASLNGPNDICLDLLGNIYIADYTNNRVRKINTSGTIFTVAGNGTAGFPTDDEIATSAAISPWGICSDVAGNLYIADGYARVYKLNLSGHLIFYAGNGANGSNGDGGYATLAETTPFYIKMDKFGNLIIAEFQNAKIRMVNSLGYIYTIAGNGVRGYLGDGGPATAGEINSPGGLAIDSCNNIFIADSHDWRIRELQYAHCNYLQTSETVGKSEISIYPNPAKDLININNFEFPSKYLIVNLFGSIMAKGELKEKNSSISLQNLAQGIYMLVLCDSIGNRIVRKLIIQ